MANQILRPADDGAYTAWQGYSLGVPHASIYDLIREADANGDDSYCSASTPATFTVTLGSVVGGSWPRPVRVSSVRVVATCRTTGASATAHFRLRALGQDFEFDDFAVTSAAYVEVWQTCTQSVFGPDHWDLPTINHLEAGLTWVSGDEMRCTKLELVVNYEVTPHYTLRPNANGTLQQWSVQPAGSPAYMVVSGARDGDRSYLYDSTINDVSLFPAENLPAVLAPPNIDRVDVTALVKNVGTVAEVAGTMLRSGVTNFRGGTDTVGTLLPADRKWYQLRQTYLNDPNVAWPSGNPAAGAWLAAGVNALEIGVENAGGGDFRCTETNLEVWLRTAAITTWDALPTADGYHQDWTIIVPGPAAWGAVCEDPPDDAGSYVVLDATAAGTPQYASFVMAGAGAVPAGQRIDNVELRCRVRLGNLPHSTATVAPLLRSVAAGTPETYVGHPQLLEGMAGTWFDVVWNFSVSPYTGLPWVDLVEVMSHDWGFAVLDGTMLLSRIRTHATTVVDYRGVPDPTDLQLTNLATVTYLPRSLVDGTIFAVTQFSVGTGGYSVPAPYTVTPVNPAAIALTSEVYRANIAWLEYDVTGAPWTVDYWCRVPRSVAQGGIGEIGLWAIILWSPIPVEIGTYFLYALAHFPCQSRHENDVEFYVVQIQY